jgi:hypothetical protein
MRVNLNNFQLKDYIKDKYESYAEIKIGLSALIALLPTMTYKEHDKLRYKHGHAVMRFWLAETPEPRRQDMPFVEDNVEWGLRRAIDHEEGSPF